MIELCGLTRRYDGRAVVDALDLVVERGELVVLLGGSGCGKTTTLKMINRLIQPSAGHVTIDGVDTRTVETHALRRRIGYGFQQVGLFPHLDVARNVGVTPELLGWDAARIARRVDQLLELVQLDPALFRHRRPAELSGGQQQRVGLARALAAEPEVLLLDEPFGAVDPLTRDHLQAAFLDIRRELGLTVVFVTHDMLEALLLGDRIAVMHEGRLLQVGTPHALLAEPADPVVASLMEAPRRQSRRVQEHLSATAANTDGETS
ncbi:MAG: ABC transporter ATP-binding protein [Myxococcota bacterium]